MLFLLNSVLLTSFPVINQTSHPLNQCFGHLTGIVSDLVLE